MQKKARIFAVMNRKGGVGKTTSAVSLAHGLARKIEGTGHVLIIDLDPQGNVATSLGLAANGKDVARVLTGEVAAEQAILHADRALFERRRGDREHPTRAIDDHVRVRAGLKLRSGATATPRSPASQRRASGPLSPAS